MSPHLPPPIPAYAEGTFAHFTIKHRLPKILADVKSQVGKGGHDDPRWSALQSAILTGRKLDPQLFAADTPFWRDKLAGLAGTRWSELPFFDLEFLFYHAINSIAADLRPGLDVFASMRGASLCEALPQIARALESTDAIDLEAALLLATSGNEADLSQIVRQEQHVSSLLKDHRHEIIERLQMNDDDTIQLVADNAGAELCFDLVLVDVVLGLRRGAVELQLKPRPMFVSDALITDVEATIAGFDEQGALSRIAKLATRLKQALRDGRLVLRAPADWAEPRHMNALDSNLLSDLRRATLVLVKGDLNYRRFFEDRAWPADVPVSVASVATGMYAFALRVLKSDSIVGLESAEVSRLFEADPDWRSNSRHSVVQRVDKGERDEGHRHG